MYQDERGYLRDSRNTREHREIAERALGRKLTRNEIMHHLDYNKANNVPSNLVVCTRAYHMLLHARTDCILAGYHPATHSRCSYHKCYEPIVNFNQDRQQWNGLSALCKEAQKLTHTAYKWGWTDMLRQQYRRVTEGEICWLPKEVIRCAN